MVRHTSTRMSKVRHTSTRMSKVRHTSTRILKNSVKYLHISCLLRCTDERLHAYMYSPMCNISLVPHLLKFTRHTYTGSRQGENEQGKTWTETWGINATTGLRMGCKQGCARYDRKSCHATVFRDRLHGVYHAHACTTCACRSVATCMCVHFCVNFHEQIVCTYIRLLVNLPTVGFNTSRIQCPCTRASLYSPQVIHIHSLFTRTHMPCTKWRSDTWP